MKSQPKRRLEATRFTQESAFAIESSGIEKVHEQTCRGLKSKPEILIVEDDLSFSQMLESILRDYSLISAANGAIGLDLFRQKSPDLVITDLIMPQMNGFQLIEELNKYSHVPIIAISGYEIDYRSYHNHIVRESTAAFLTKPFILSDLLTLIDQKLSRY